MHKIVYYNTKRFEEKRMSLDKFGTFECQKISQYEEFVLLRIIPFLVIIIIYGLFKLNAPFEIILPSFVIAFLIF